MIRGPVRKNQIVNSHNFLHDLQEPFLDVVSDEAITVLAWEKILSPDHKQVSP